MQFFSNKKQIFYLIYAIGFLAAAIIYARPQKPEQVDYPKNFRVLVFSKTLGYRHASIPDGIAAIRSLGEESGFTVDATEDAAVFTDENLKQYRVIVFLSPSGNGLFNQEQREAFVKFIQGGGGFAGIHAATTAEYVWPWYGRLVGNYFKTHPPIQEAVTRVTDPAHPSTVMLPEQWPRRDEWYEFRLPFSPDLRILVTVDESTYSGGMTGVRHPVTWCHEYDGGRAWYTAMGHSSEDYQDPLFRRHILGGILWASGRKR
ncbi:MAG: ThuA domain-containing protein [Candidatus Omnitrophota bacterium]